MAAIGKADLEDFPSFGRRLMELARDKNIGTPSLLADALYKNQNDLVKPAERKNKYGKNVKDEKHDIDAITRTVQKHFNEEEAYNVQSKFLLAYSRLFNCSLDYLYGNTTVKSCDLEIRAVCDKVHIDEKAVLNLMEEYDSDPEVFSCTEFWSEIMSGDLFTMLPYAYLKYRMEVQEYKDLEKKIAAIENAEPEASDLEYRAMMESRRVALDKIMPGKCYSCEGALDSLMQIFSDYISTNVNKWVDSQHKDLGDNYYENELKKIKMLDDALKEGSTL